MSDRHTIARLQRQVLTLKAQVRELTLLNGRHIQCYSTFLSDKVDAEIRIEMALLALQGKDIEVKK
jgi:hypothetical protein